MFSTYLKTAIRFFFRNKTFTILNVCGLALSLLTFLLLTFYVKDELSYDRFNKNADRIFRINTDLKFGATISSRAITSPAMAKSLQQNFPEIENFVRLLPDAEVFKKGNEFLSEDKGVYTDQSVFDVFSFEILNGNAKTVFNNPYAIVLTKSMALKYFNSTNIIGKTIEFMNDSNLHVVTAVISDIPRQSHFSFDFFLSMKSVQISESPKLNALFPFSINNFFILHFQYQFFFLSSFCPADYFCVNAKLF
jgi:putative ABC transport system permease protein